MNRHRKGRQHSLLLCRLDRARVRRLLRFHRLDKLMKVGEKIFGVSANKSLFDLAIGEICVIRGSHALSKLLPRTVQN